ncbi:unnamed protein product [Cuscuta epithymum]|uniref:C2H2-type domain-containing protein n=1 Tax=Cuscuta epithymum TaxID=186058 RepID=A0AAV0FIC3_9ASTE|nr:unnamed protein product [Cuscuta epithymum]
MTVMMMKRSRKEVAADAEVLAMANCLDLLSHPGAAVNAAASLEFGCRTCTKRFQSFQALGGHMASHKRIKTVKREESERKGHKCVVCGLVFGLGQALGGHMRKHRTDLLQVNTAKISKRDEKEEYMDGVYSKMDGERAVMFDLNLIPQRDWMVPGEEAADFPRTTLNLFI